MARLYADENFPLPVVEALRRLGHDVVTLQETGEGGRSMPDDEVLAVASRAGRGVLTLNRRHFLRLHREQPLHRGIVVCTFDLDFAGQARRIDAALRVVPDVTGQVVRINREG